MNDALGIRGEALFVAMLTEFHGQTPLFRPQFLGDKWPTVDFFVELIGTENVIPFFFVQVRATRTGYTKRKRLKIQVSKDELQRMATYPAPTYIVGIDEKREIGYIVSANKARALSAASISTEFPVNEINRQTLWNEVFEYWESREKKSLESNFVDPEWE